MGKAIWVLISLSLSLSLALSLVKTQTNKGKRRDGQKLCGRDYNEETDQQSYQSLRFGTTTTIET
jgi:hypothetical protein